MTRLSEDQIRNQLRRSKGPMTREQMEAALRYQATHPGASFIAAADVIRGVRSAADVQRYAATDAGGLPPMVGNDDDARSPMIHDDAAQELLDHRNEADRQRNEIAEYSRRTGTDDAVVRRAYGAVQRGEYPNLYSAVQAVQQKLANQSEWMRR
jgi:hypothetical protein